jgi:predicted dehydrogenase
MRAGGDFVNKLRLIQCGVGGFGRGWLAKHTRCSDDFELAAIVDISAEALEQAGAIATVPAGRRFRSLEAALEKVAADAVLTVTPPAAHVRHAELAFAHGLHLMTEKPIADTMEHARRMVRLARQSGRQLVVSQNYRYRPAIQKLRHLLAEGVVGAFGHGRMEFFVPADFTGTFRETLDNVLIVDMAVHHFDLVRCVTGRDITRVRAHSFRPAWSWYAHHSAAHAWLELEGGLPFAYCGDWSARGRATSWNGDWRLQCAEGSLHLGRDDELFIARSERWSKNETIQIVDPGPLPLTEQAATLRLFAEAIRSGQPPEISGEDNLRTFGAVMAAVRSACEGRDVEVAELLAG